MNQTLPYVLTPKEAGDFTPELGRKADGLANLSHTSVPVPPAVIIPSTTFARFARHQNLHNQIDIIINNVNPYQPAELHAAAKHIQKLITQALYPKPMYQALTQAYQHQLNHHWFTLALSPVQPLLHTIELPSHPLKGEAVFLDSIRQAWAAYFSPQFVYQYHQQSHAAVNVPAIMCTQYYEPEISGFLYTLDPFSANKQVYVIQAIWGSPQANIVPDTYYVDKTSLTILRKQTVPQTQQYQIDRFGHHRQSGVPAAKRNRDKLSPDDIKHLCQLGKTLHNHYLKPQHISFVISKANALILESKPMQDIPAQTVPSLTETYKPENLTQNLKPLATGLPASPGLVSAPVYLISKPEAINHFPAGSIAVTTLTTANLIPLFKKARGLVTQSGGPTSHLSIIAREIGCPAVVGVKDISSKIKTNEVITLNGATGEIFKGGIPAVQDPSLMQIKPSLPVDPYTTATATKLYLNVSSSEKALKYAGLPAAGVGLVRGEILLSALGADPYYLINHHKADEVRQYLTKTLTEITKTFGDRPVLYRFADYHTSELAQFTPHSDLPFEENAFLGYRGAFRLTRDTRLFDVEAGVIQKLREAGYKGLHLVLPFCRYPQEIIAFKKLLTQYHLSRTPALLYYITLDTPASILNLEAHAAAGIDGIIINLNHLSCLTLGIDPNNPEINRVFEDQNPAILWLATNAAAKANSLHLDSIAFGRVVSQSKDVAGQLVQAGIGGLTLDPEMFHSIKAAVYQAELERIK